MRALNSKQLLMVDDNQDFLNCAVQFLRTLPGVDLVGEATSGEQALELTAALRPDLVLMDIEMRGMTGLAATAQIKRLPDAPKVVVITMHSQREFRLLAGKAGADGFLQKDDLVAELPLLLATLFPTGSPRDKEQAGPG